MRIKNPYRFQPRGVKRCVHEVEPVAVLTVELGPSFARPIVVDVEVVPDALRLGGEVGIGAMEPLPNTMRTELGGGE